MISLNITFNGEEYGEREFPTLTAAEQWIHEQHSGALRFCSFGQGYYVNLENGFRIDWDGMGWSGPS
jgi:hypothetical protein